MIRDMSTPKPRTNDDLTLREAATLLKYRSLKSVKRRIADGSLKARKLGTGSPRERMYVSRRSLAAYQRRTAKSS